MSKFINVTSKVMEKLPEIIQEKGLRLEDTINKIDFETSLKSNNEAMHDLVTDSGIIKEPKNGKCHFIDGNRAYLDFSGETDYRLYISINDKNERFCLTLYHFFKIFKSNNHGIIETEMMNYFGFNTDEERDKSRFREKYTKNLRILESSRFSKEYSKLYKSISTSIDLLKILNNLGFVNVLNNKFQYKGEHIFFSSSRYIAKKLKEFDIVKYGKISKSKVLRRINYLAVLGIIEKVEEKNVPQTLIEGNNENKATINYFIIKEMNNELLNNATETIEKIEKKHEKIKERSKYEEIKALENEKRTISNKKDKNYKLLTTRINRLKRERAKLTASTITEEKTKEYFGEEVSDVIYKNIINYRKELEKKRQEENNKHFNTIIKNNKKEVELARTENLPF